MGKTRFKDLSGQKFGDLTVVRFAGWYYAPSTGARKSQWLCRCEICGSERVYNIATLTSRVRIGSRGCSNQCMSRTRAFTGNLSSNLSGRRFGRLTILRLVGIQDLDSSSKWLCHCDCGKEIIAPFSALKSGSVLSCGCLDKEIERAVRNDNSPFYPSNKLSVDTLRTDRQLKPLEENPEIFWDPESRMFVATVSIYEKQIYLGIFPTLNDADIIHQFIKKDALDQTRRSVKAIP